MVNAHSPGQEPKCNEHADIVSALHYQARHHTVQASGTKVAYVTELSLLLPGWCDDFLGSLVGMRGSRKSVPVRNAMGHIHRVTFRSYKPFVSSGYRLERAGAI